MLNINVILNHVKARLGAFIRDLELSDEAIIKVLQEETLPTLSIYMPYYCSYMLDVQKSAVQPLMNTYFIPEKLDDEFTVLDVQAVIPSFRGMSNTAYFYMPLGGDLQSIITNLAGTKFANTVYGSMINPMTWNYIRPNQLRLDSMYSNQNMLLILKTTHRRDFATFLPGSAEVVKKLALLDVALDIYSVRKYFSNINTTVANFNLDLDFFQSAYDKREELVEKLRLNQLKNPGTKKIYIA